MNITKVWVLSRSHMYVHCCAVQYCIVQYGVQRLDVDASSVYQQETLTLSHTHLVVHAVCVQETLTHLWHPPTHLVHGVCVDNCNYLYIYWRVYGDVSFSLSLFLSLQMIGLVTCHKGQMERHFYGIQTLSNESVKSKVSASFPPLSPRGPSPPLPSISP